ncbi:MAG TPA: carboxymuconolactone decarboxylase family protein [Gaiellaceae bacterium]|jgi:alkylhydroperoxidase family enzyme
MENERIAWVKTAQDAGELANILASHSLNPDALAAHVRLYRTIMFGDSPLTRTEREAIAVAVSAVNDCHY